MPESVFTQTIPALLAGGGCVRAAGFEAGADGVPAVLPPETGVAEDAGLLAGVVEAAGVAAGVDAVVEAGSAEADFFERLFFGAAALFSADVAVLAAESSDAVFFDFLLGLVVSDAEAEESALSLLSAEADSFERLFLGAAAVELSAATFSSADALFLDPVFFFVVEVVELSAAAFSPSAVDFLAVLFFFGAVPASAEGCEVEESAEVESAFFFFLVFFFVESAWL